ncbi:hypothetical protein BGZ93_003334 [Podila epicladia]|nr:hypothetical protein BGZ93_003334 [Podila epicladia]
MSLELDTPNRRRVTCCDSHIFAHFQGLGQTFAHIYKTSQLPDTDPLFQARLQQTTGPLSTPFLSSEKVTLCALNIFCIHDNRLYIQEITSQSENISPTNDRRSRLNLTSRISRQNPLCRFMSRWKY